MKRVILAMAAVFLSGSMFLNAAEVNRYARNSQDLNEMQSGIFLGLGLGGTMSQLDYSARLNIGDSTARPMDDILNGIGFDVGAVIGYKWLWQYSGLRVYANVDYVTVALNGNYGNYKASAINAGGNIDALFRFYDFNKDFGVPVDIGAFIGLGLGVDKFNIPDKMLRDVSSALVATGSFTDANDLYNMISNKNVLKDQFFNAWLNIGLNTNIYRNHSVELAFKVPFIKHTVINQKQGQLSVNAKANMPFSFKFMYIYSF